jgi:hypothetical protein
MPSALPPQENPTAEALDRFVSLDGESAESFLAQFSHTDPALSGNTAAITAAFASAEARTPWPGGAKTERAPAGARELADAMREFEADTGSDGSGSQDAADPTSADDARLGEDHAALDSIEISTRACAAAKPAANFVLPPLDDNFITDAGSEEDDVSEEEGDFSYSPSVRPGGGQAPESTGRGSFRPSETGGKHPAILGPPEDLQAADAAEEPDTTDECTGNAQFVYPGEMDENAGAFPSERAPGGILPASLMRASMLGDNVDGAAGGGAGDESSRSAPTDAELAATTESEVVPFDDD